MNGFANVVDKNCVMCDVYIWHEQRNETSPTISSANLPAAFPAPELLYCTYVQHCSYSMRVISHPDLSIIRSKRLLRNCCEAIGINLSVHGRSSSRKSQRRLHSGKCTRERIYYQYVRFKDIADKVLHPTDTFPFLTNHPTLLHIFLRRIDVYHFRRSTLRKLMYLIYSQWMVRGDVTVPFIVSIR